MKIGKRRQAREIVLKILYQIEVSGENPTTVLDSFWERNQNVNVSVKEFASDLAKGILEKYGELDDIIKQKLKNWRFDRVAVIDKNILRMGIFEILYRDDIPNSVSINEAIEIAKKYGDKDSSRFVNGILDKVSKSMLLK